MNGLQWDELDFMTCLEVEPTLDEDFLEYRYLMKRDGLKLELLLVPYRSQATFSFFLGESAAPFTVITLLVGGTSYDKDKIGERLTFHGCKFATDPYSYLLPQFDQSADTYGFTADLRIKPQISLKFF